MMSKIDPLRSDPQVRLKVIALYRPVLEGCVGCGSCVKACITSPSSFLFKAAAG